MSRLTAWPRMPALACHAVWRRPAHCLGPYDAAGSRRGGLEDGPADLDAVLKFVWCVGRGHEVVLADGAVDTELAFADVGSDRGVGPVEVGEWAVVDGYRQFGGWNLDHPGPRPGRDRAGDREERDHVGDLDLEQLTWVGPPAAACRDARRANRGV